MRLEKLEICDQEGNVRIVLYCGPDGLPGISLQDDAGLPRIDLGINPDQKPVFSLLDETQTALGLGFLEKTPLISFGHFDSCITSEENGDLVLNASSGDVVLFEKNSCPFVVKNNPLPGDAELQLRTLRE